VKSVALFDLDGTLVDADHLHYASWRAMLLPYGVDLSLDDYRTQFMGAPNSLILSRYLPRMEEVQGLALIDEKEAMFRRLATTLEPAPGLNAFLTWLEERNVAIGVVTNAPRANAEQQLRGIGLEDRFATLVIGEELAFSKPHPLPYLTGLERLQGSAPASLAFEDSLSGIAAARAAGIAVVGLTTGLSEERLLAEGAGLAIPHFADPRLLPFAAARFGLA
jgi:HAD superfamily hydrolase (TIGR01509 family)